jgi:hypothetical protein
MMSEIVDAMMIGDGYVCKNGSFGFSHSIVQEKYALWKKQRVIDTTGVKFYKDNTTKRCVSKRNSIS